MKKYSTVDTISDYRVTCEWLGSTSGNKCRSVHNPHVQLCRTASGLIWAMKNRLPLWPLVQTAGMFSWQSSRSWWDPGICTMMWTIQKQQENSKHRVCGCWRTWSQLVWKCIKWSLLSLPVPVQTSKKERKEALSLYKQLNCLLEQNSSSHFPGLLSLELSTPGDTSVPYLSLAIFCVHVAANGVWECAVRDQRSETLRWDTRQCKAHLESEIFMLNRQSYLWLLQNCYGLAKKCVCG